MSLPPATPAMDMPSSGDDLGGMDRDDLGGSDGM
jgi:hypothetical protein